MSEDNRILKPEDYLEPGCPMCENPYGVIPESRSVPLRRITEKLDEYMSRRDYKGAERHLLYWLEEALLGHDRRGELMIRNELVGHFRKEGNRSEALRHGAEALRLLDELGMNDTITAGTTCVNVATAFQSFGDPEAAAQLFERAAGIYESAPGTGPELLGGLYNNMALTYVALHRFREADALYRKALGVMEKVPGGEAEQAITYLNMADAIEEEEGMEEGEKKISALLDRAAELLDSPAIPRDGYYAFVCEKCAPAFSRYGYFLESAELSRRAEAIYERD